MPNLEDDYKSKAPARAEKFTDDGIPSWVDDDPIVQSLAPKAPRPKKEYAKKEYGDKPAYEKREPRAYSDKPREPRSFSDKPYEKREPRKLSPVSEDERIARVIARAGLCSRREAEEWILAGRVKLNNEILTSPAINVKFGDKILVDNKLLPERERTRLWLYHKPKGLVTTHEDPEGRPTLFDNLPEELPRVVSIGRLDINTEGLLLLTNDGGLSRALSHPTTGWLRRYRVRAHGEITEAQIARLQNGMSIDGIDYAPMEAEIDKIQGSNVWLILGLREGKNREVKNVLSAIGLEVNRLIRISFGPFQLNEMAEGEISEVRTGHLREQLGPELLEISGADLENPMRDRSERMKSTQFGVRTRTWRDYDAREAVPTRPKRQYKGGDRTPSETAEYKQDVNVEDRKGRSVEVSRARSEEPVERFERKEYDASPSAGYPKPEPRAERPRREDGDRPSFGDRPPRPAFGERKPFGDRPRREDGDRPARPAFGDRKPYGDRPQRQDGDRPARPAFGDRKPFGDRPRREDGDRPSFGDRPPRPPFGERKPFGDRPQRQDGDRPPRPPFGERKPFGDRPQRQDGDRPARPAFGDRKPFGDRPRREDGDRPARPAFGDRKPFGDRPRREDGDRPSFGDRPPRGDRPSFGDRPARPPFGERKPYGDRPQRQDGDRPSRPAFGDRPARPPFGERKPFGDRPRREDGDRPSFGDRPARPAFGERKPYGDRPQRQDGDRPARAYVDKPFDNRPPRRDDSERKPYAGKSFGDKPRSGGFGGKSGGGFGGKPSGGFGGKPGGFSKGKPPSRGR